jgi:D-alanyl-D-alanine carboxypeptidase
MSNYQKKAAVWNLFKRAYPTIFSFIVLGVFIALGYILNQSANKDARSDLGADLTTVIPSIVNQSPFDLLNLEAAAVYVYDPTSKRVIFEKRSEQQLPLASITKLMTAVVASESAPLYTTVSITKDDLSAEGNSGLKVGERWSLRDLLSFTLVSSSNDGAKALASVASRDGTFTQKAGKDQNRSADFVLKMNQEAQNLKLTQTFFLNETGLDVSSTTSGAYGSARDVADLLSYVLVRYGEIIEDTTYERIDIPSLDQTHHAINTNKALRAIPGIVASKTGFTDLSGGNLAVVFEIAPSHPIIAVVLGSTPTGRFTDMSLIASTALVYYRNQMPIQ